MDWGVSSLIGQLPSSSADGFFSNLHSFDAGVSQGSVISPVLFILFRNDLLTCTSSSNHSFADDTFLSSSFSFNPNDHASSDISLHWNISASLLSDDLTVIEKWGKDNLVSLNQSKTKQAVISCKRNQNIPAVFMTGDKLDTSASFTQLGLSLSSNLTWKTHTIPLLDMHLSNSVSSPEPVGFLIFSPSIYIQVRNPSFFRLLLPSLRWCSKSILCLLDKVQYKAICLINNPNLAISPRLYEYDWMKKLQSVYGGPTATSYDEYSA